MPKEPIYNPELTIGGGEDAGAFIECRSCEHVNFQVTIEPSYVDRDKASVRANFEKTSRRVQFCPFCGGEDLGQV